MLASIRNVVLCHMATKSLQVRPDNNQGINTALLATSMVRTGWEERCWFSPLTFHWHKDTLCYGKNDFGWYNPVNMAPDTVQSSPSSKCLPPWPAGLLLVGQGSHLLRAAPTHGTAGRSSRRHLSPQVTDQRRSPGQYFHVHSLFLYNLSCG